MDDLRAALAPFDPDAPLTPAPEPWDYLPTPAARDAAPWAMAEMIAAEPAAAVRIARRLAADGSAAALAALVREAAGGGGPVIVTGCGTSEHAAMGVAEILRDAWRDAGLPGWGPVSAQAFELELEPPRGGLVIGVSHEGGTGATIAALREARARGVRTAAITGSAHSPIGAAADVILETVEMDRSWCHTIGYLSPLVAAATVAELLAGRAPAPGSSGARVREGIDAAWTAALDGSRDADRMGAGIARAAHLLVVASGVDRVAARELVLKIEEAAWVPSAARDLETFLHGHLPATGERTALVVILTERGALDRRATRVRQALAAANAVGIACGAILSASAAALVPAALTETLGRIVVPDGDDLAAAASSLLGTAAPLQLVTLQVSAHRGTNPDPIRRDDPVYLRAAELADDPAI
ncbi:MAG TPA: SIS domain-containing protein [Candidatus Limnocylindrales bacterium]|nr:SIS domain-containing protein [Candidatus Limnocylindrales bacterium]